MKHNYYLFIALALLFQASGCYAQTENEIEVGGIKRQYIIFVPKDTAKKKMPLLIALHGGGGQAKGFDKLTKFSELVESKKFVVVYPQGVDRRWNDGRETIQRKEIDDVKFISTLIDEIGKKYPIDSRRIYATGASNGGMMSFRLACDLSDKIAAVASVIANLPKNIVGQCQPKRPLSVLIMLGTKDPLMPFNGGDIGGTSGGGLGGKVISAQESVDFWVKHNEIKSKPKVENLPDTDTDDGTKTKREVYTKGKTGTEVVLYTIENGGHTWAGGIQYLPENAIGKTSRDFIASEEIWEFFSRQKLSEK